MRLLIAAVLTALILPLTGCSRKAKPVEIQPEPSNHAPATPWLPDPADNAININVPCVFTWACYDSDQGDTITYTVHIGAGAFTDTINGVPSENFMANSLLAGNDYVWRVTAMDNHGAAATGPTWHFRTQ